MATCTILLFGSLVVYGMMGIAREMLLRYFPHMPLWMVNLIANLSKRFKKSGPGTKPLPINEIFQTAYAEVLAPPLPRHLNPNLIWTWDPIRQIWLFTPPLTQTVSSNIAPPKPVWNQQGEITKRRGITTSTPSLAEVLKAPDSSRLPQEPVPESLIFLLESLERSVKQANEFCSLVQKLPLTKYGTVTRQLLRILPNLQNTLSAYVTAFPPILERLKRLLNKPDLTSSCLITSTILVKRSKKSRRSSKA